MLFHKAHYVRLWSNSIILLVNTLYDTLSHLSDYGTTCKG